MSGNDRNARQGGSVLLIKPDDDPGCTLADQTKSGLGQATNCPMDSHAGRVLVVDDNVDSAESLGLLLSLMKYQVRIAHDGPTALEVVREFQPEIVLLDIGLPGMDGYEIARRLRRQPGTENVLLAAVTGYGAEEDRLLSREAGFDHHLVKPVGADTLRSILVLNSPPARSNNCRPGKPI